MENISRIIILYRLWFAVPSVAAVRSRTKGKAFARVFDLVPTGVGYHEADGVVIDHGVLVSGYDNSLRRVGCVVVHCVVVLVLNTLGVTC